MSSRKKLAVRDVLLMCILWIIITQIFAWLSFNRLRLTEPDKREHFPEKGLTSEFKPHPLNFLEMHARQDTAWYFSVAYEGYSYSPKKQSNVSFFPLYPFMMKLGNNIFEKLTPGIIVYYRYLISGIIISVASLILASIYLFKLLRIEGNSEKISFMSVFLLLIFPSSYFLTSVYSESLFLFLVIAFFYSYRKKYYFQAAVFGYFAALTRATGFLLVIPLLYDYLKNIRYLSVKDSVWRMIPLLSNLTGILTFMFFLDQKFGDPLLFVKSQARWGRITFLSATSVNYLFSYIQNGLTFNYATRANMILEMLFLVFGLALSLYVMRKVSMFYGIWSLAGVLFPLTSGVLASQGRYTLIIFPLFLGLAILVSKNMILKYAYLMSSVLMLGLYTVLFVNGYWSI